MDLDSHDCPVTGIRSCHRKFGCCGPGSHVRRQFRSGTESFHGGGRMPVERGHGNHEHLRNFRRAFPSVPPAAAASAPQCQPRPPNTGCRLRQRLCQPAGAGKCRHASGNPGCPPHGPELRRRASNELCLLVVLNTASIQLLPATIASVRAAAGSATPFDILPAVWLSSILSVSAGLAAAWLLSRRERSRL